jgi:hypothetical protein
MFLVNFLYLVLENKYQPNSYGLILQLASIYYGYKLKLALHLPLNCLYIIVVQRCTSVLSIFVLGPLGLRVYRVVEPCVRRGPTPRLYNSNPSLGIN